MSKGLKVFIIILAIILIICITCVSIFLSKYIPLRKEMEQLVWEKLRVYDPDFIFDGIENKTGYKIARYKIKYFDDFVVIVEYDGLKITYVGIEEEKDG